MAEPTSRPGEIHLDGADITSTGGVSEFCNWSTFGSIEIAYELTIKGRYEKNNGYNPFMLIETLSECAVCLLYPDGLFLMLVVFMNLSSEMKMAFGMNFVTGTAHSTHLFMFDCTWAIGSSIAHLYGMSLAVDF